MWLTTDEFNFVAACQSIDHNAVTTAFPCRVVNMGRYQSMVAMVNMGAGSTYEIYVNYASTTTITAGSTGGYAIGYYRYSGAATAASTCDTLSTRAAMSTTASWDFDATGSPNCTGYLEIKSDDLPNGYPYIAVSISNSAQAHPVAVNYVCKPRYPQATMMIAGS